MRLIYKVIVKIARVVLRYILPRMKKKAKRKNGANMLRNHFTSVSYIVKYNPKKHKIIDSLLGLALSPRTIQYF